MRESATAKIRPKKGGELLKMGDGCVLQANSLSKGKDYARTAMCRMQFIFQFTLALSHIGLWHIVAHGSKEHSGIRLFGT